MDDKRFAEITAISDRFDDLPDGAYLAAMDENGVDAGELVEWAEECETRAQCELKGCKSENKKAVGSFQVYDNSGPTPVATMNRVAWMCQGCVDFAKSCGMEVKAE